MQLVIPGSRVVQGHWYRLSEHDWEDQCIVQLAALIGILLYSRCFHSQWHFGTSFYLNHRRQRSVKLDYRQRTRR